MANTTRRKIQYDVGFNNIDTKQLDEVKKQLQEIQKLTNTKFKQNGIFDTSEMQQVRTIAKEVEQILTRAYNPKIDSVNVTKFNSELAKTGLNARTLYNELNKAGPAGTQAFSKISSAVMSTNKELKQTHNFLDNIATTLGNTIKWNAASGAVNALTGKVQSAVTYVERLDTSLNDIRIVTGQSADEMDKFAIKANKAAENLGKSTLDYTKAALTYYQQGLSDEEVEARTNVTLKASNVTGQDTADTAEQLTAVWNGFKVAADETEEYVDKLAAVGAATASDLEELSTGMAKVASGAASMGVNIDQLTASLATIVSTTRQDASSVGTALKTIYSRIADIEAGADDAEATLGNYSGKMAELGFNVLDSEGKMRDLGEVMEEIGNGWNDLSREQQIYLAQTMAGTRQYNNLIALFDNWNEYQKALNVSQKAAGTLQQQQNVYLESTTAHINQLNTSLDSLYNSTLDADTVNTFADALRVLVNLTDNWVQSLGGGKGVLLNLGAIGLNVFNKQISEGIATTIHNLKVASNNAEEFKSKMQWSDEVVNNPSVYGKEQSQITGSEQKLLQMQNILTQAEQDTAEALTQEAKAALEAKAAFDSKTKSAKEYVSQIAGVTGNFDDDAGLQQLGAELTDLSTIYEDMIQSFKDNPISIKADSDINVETQKVKALTDALANLQTLKNGNQLTADQSKLVDSYEADYKNKIQEALNRQVNNSLFQGEDVDSVFNDNRITALLAQADDKFAQYLLSIENRLKDFSQKAKSSIDDANAQVEELLGGEVQAQLDENIDNTQSKLKTFWDSFADEAKINGIVQITGGLTSLGATMSNMTSIFKTLQDESLSTGDKVTQMMTSIGTTALTAVQGVSALKSGLTMLKVASAGTVAAGITVAVAAIGAVAAGIKYASEAAERARTKVSDSIKSYQEATSNLESLNSELDANKEKLEALLDIDFSSRTTEQQEEIANLQAQNALLETKIELEKKLAHKNRQETIDNYEDAENSGAYDQNTSFKVGNTSRDIFNHTDTLDATDNEAWNNYVRTMQAMSSYYQNPDAGNDANFAKILDSRLEKAKQAREDALEKIESFNNENFDTWVATAQAYLDEEEKIPEKLSEHILGAMTSAGTIQSQTDGAVQAALSGGEEEFDKIIAAKANKTKDNSWADILDEASLKDMQSAADSLLITLDDLMDTVFSGDRSWGEFTNSIKDAEDETAKFKGVSDDTIDALPDLIEKMQSKGTSSLTDKELKSLQEVETELAKLGGKYTNIGDIRNQNEIEYIKLIRQGREELRKNNAVEAAQDVTTGKSARAGTSNVRNIQLQVDDKRFREDMKELLDEKYALEVEINTDLSEATQEITNAYTNIQKGFNMIDKNLKVSGDEVVSFMQMFPDLTDVILENTSRCADGSIQFSQDGFEAFKTAATNELKVDTEKTKTEIQNQITKYESEISQLDTTIEALDAYIQAVETGDGDTVDSKQKATEALNQLNSDLYNNAVAYANKAAGDTVNTEADAQTDITDNYEKALENRLQLANQYYFAQNGMIQELVQAEKDAAEGVTHAWSNADAKDLYQNGYRAKLWSSDDANNTQYVVRQDVSTGDYDTSDKDFSGILKTRDALAAYRDYLKTGIGQLNDYLSQLDASNYSLDHFTGKGGSTSQKKETAHIAEIVDKLHEELDAYHKINIEIKQLQNSYSALQAKSKELFGTELVKNYEAQLTNLGEQYRKLTEKQKINASVIEKTKSVLEAYSGTDAGGKAIGVTFDADGQISNYNDLLSQTEAAINAKVAEYDGKSYEDQQTEAGKTLKQEIEQLKKDRELLKDSMDAYEQALNEDSQEILENLQTVHEEILEVNQAMIDFKSPKLDDYIEEVHLLSDALNDITSALSGLESLIGNSDIDTYASAWSEFGLDLLDVATKVSQSYDAFEEAGTQLNNFKNIFSQASTNFKGIEGKWNEAKAMATEKNADWAAANAKRQAGETLSDKELETLSVGDKEAALHAQNLDLLQQLSTRLDEIGKGFNLKDPKTWFNTVKDLSSYLQDFKGTITNLLNSNISVNTGAAADLSGVFNALGTEMSATLGSITAGISIGVSVVNAAVSAIDSLWNHIQKVKVRMANESAELAKTQNDAMNQWMEYRKSFEILTGNKSLGQLKQSLADLTDLLQEFGGGTSMDGVKETIDGMETLKGRVDELNQSITDGSYSKTYGNLWKKGLSQALSDLKTYTDDLMSQVDKVQSILENWSEQFVSAWQYIGEQMDKQVKRYQTITNEIEHKKNMMTLLYGDEAYSELESWYNLQKKVNDDQLSFEQERVNYWKQRMSELEEGSEAWDEAESQYQSALDSFNSALKEQIQTIIDKYTNAIHKIFAEMTNQLTSGAGTDWLNTQMNLMNKYSDHYLDGVNATYQIVSLQNKFMDAINNAEGNVTAQERIKKLMDEQLSDLKSRDKLTKYDVERAEKLLEIETARQALKEAQNNNSKMRLTRDSQGNYSYTYVADEDAINEAQQKLADAQNSLYNFDKDQYSANLSEMYSIYTEYMSKLQEVATDQSLSEEERLRQSAELTETYTNYITGIQQDNSIIRNNLASSAFENYASMQDTARDTTASDYETWKDLVEKVGLSIDDMSKQGITFTADFRTAWADMTKEQQDKVMGELVPTWNSAMQGMIDKMSGDGEDSFKNKSAKALEAISAAQQQYTKDVEATKTALGGVDFTKVNQGMKEWTSYSDSIKAASTEILNKYKDQATELIDLNKKAQEYKATWDDILKDIKDSVEESQKIQTSQAENATQDDVRGAQKKTTTAVTTVGGAATGAAIGAAVGGPVGAIAGGVLGGIGGFLGGLFFGDVGGYTGKWNGESEANKKAGKIGILHEQELVLSKDDTENILAAVDTVRSISDSLRGQALETANSYTSDIDAAPQAIVQPITQSVQQEVHIDATFPNVTDHKEVELALNNLVNTASQKVAENKVENGSVGKLST